MRLSARLTAGIVIVMAGLLISSAPLVGQYLKYPTANVPRTADGKPNLTAPETK